MAKRLFQSCLLALVVCGSSFYLAYFAGLIYAAATGPANPANSTGLQWNLRHFALPASLGLGLLTFFFAFRHLMRKGAEPQFRPRIQLDSPGPEKPHKGESRHHSQRDSR